MKEITRVHIAKQAYEVEVDAKKELEKYIAELGRYAGEAELLEDIEIRITELLAERGVVTGGVITAGDVKAVREQLGEPSDFAPDGETVTVETPSRRMYRDTDEAMLGGVAAGLAHFLGVDTVWVRLAFILLLIISFGTLLVVYAVLWLVVPPAKTATEKLQMHGKPVTLESIKSLGEQAEPALNKTAQVVQGILRYGTGVLLVLLAVGGLAATAIVGFGLPFGTTDSSPLATWRPTESWWLMAAFVLFVLAGLLFSALCFILADATFRKRWSRRVGTSVVAIITAGILTFIGGVGAVSYGYWQEGVEARAQQKTSYINLPANFKEVKKLTVKANNDVLRKVKVEYAVSDKPHYELMTLPSVKAEFAIADDSRSATLSIATSNDRRSIYTQPVLRIYGPTLESFDITGVDASYRASVHQVTLAVATHENAEFGLFGELDLVSVASERSSVVSLNDAAIGELLVDNRAGRVTAGVVRSLTVQQPDICPATDYNERSVVIVQAVTRGKLVYNSLEREAKNIKQDCGTVIIGSERNYQEGYME